jgi:curved DNA-binding protein CbpA
VPEDFVDYYELLQISSNAEPETVQRIFRMLAARYHPDNPQTGDVEKFLALQTAYGILSDREQRSQYDQEYKGRRVQPIEVFQTPEFIEGISGETNRRMGILCLLYKRRRVNPDVPGTSILELESMMSFPREHLMFTIWYLKEKGHLRQDERTSDYIITAEGVDYVHAHLRKNRLLQHLLEPGSKPLHEETREAIS